MQWPTILMSFDFLTNISVINYLFQLFHQDFVSGYTMFSPTHLNDRHSSVERILVRSCFARFGVRSELQIEH